MSELKPKEVGIGTIGDIQGERIASGWDHMSLHSVTLLTENRSPSRSEEETSKAAYVSLMKSEDSDMEYWYILPIRE